MPTRIWECTNAEYHAATDIIGASMLGTILESPATYYGRFVGKDDFGNPMLPYKASKTQDLGSAVHCLVLEPHLYDSLFWVRSEDTAGNSKAAKEKLAEQRLRNLGKTELTIDQEALAKNIAKAVLGNRMVAELMEGSIRERAIVWDEDGREYKCKTDIFIPRPNEPSDLLLDLKTSSDPYPETWQDGGRYSPIWKWHYDLQIAAHYRLGVEAHTGRPCSCGAVVVGTEPPHDVFVYDMLAWAQLGMRRRDEAIALLSECVETGDWSHRQSQTILTAMPSTYLINVTITPNHRGYHGMHGNRKSGAGIGHRPIGV